MYLIRQKYQFLTNSKMKDSENGKSARVGSFCMTLEVKQWN